MINLTLAIFLTLLITETPIITIILIIRVALLIGLITHLTLSAWFGFIIFLLYVGGILVVFLYFSSLIPNQKFYNKWIIPLFITIIIILIFIKNSITLIKPALITSENLILYFYNNLFLTNFFIIFLFVLLLIVVKLTNNKKWPLRPIL